MCFVCCLCEGPKFWEGFYGQLNNGGPGTDHGGNPPERSHLRVHDGKCLQTQTYRCQRMVWSPCLLHVRLCPCSCKTYLSYPFFFLFFFNTQFRCKYNLWEKNLKCVCVCCVCVWTTRRHYCWLWKKKKKIFKFQLNHPLPFRKAFLLLLLFAYFSPFFFFFFLYLHIYRWICLILGGCVWGASGHRYSISLFYGK